jgi:GntR family transcriptional regulator, transcriptional repressor for pyruvate dehydrogenase complex
MAPPAASRRRPPILASLSAIEVERPADAILRQLRDLVGIGALKPGDRLPAERELAAQFGVGRSHVREALLRLEFYGILQTLPQSGTVVSRLGVAALEGMISNVLSLDRDDISALSETRMALEVETARRAAERATPADIRSIRLAEQAFRERASAGDPALQEDLALHLAIAQAAHNAVLASLVGLITPDILRLNGEHKTCSRARLPVVADEHHRVVAAIEARNPDAAARAMAEHARMSHDQHFRKEAAKSGRSARTALALDPESPVARTRRESSHSVNRR